MMVMRADAMGFCFGVRRALEVALSVDDPGSVTVYGELVHNEKVLDRLEARGLRQSPEAARGETVLTRRVLLTAHGVSDRERRRLRDAGHELIDTTCPLVTRAHRAALGLAAAGYHVIVIGRPGHVEVRGLVGDLPEATVLASPEEVRRLPHARLGILAQTTTPIRLARSVRERIAALHPGREIRWVDTVCRPTKRRIEAVLELAPHVDVMVVVGGRNSNNTRRLADLAASRGTPVRHVQGPDDLDPAWFRGAARVGLTAGTSTLPETIDAVEARLREMPEGRSRASG